MFCVPGDGYENWVAASEAMTGYMVKSDKTDCEIDQIFGIDYPLPKMDMLAVHEFVSHTILQYRKAH